MMTRAHIEAMSRAGVAWYPASDHRIVATMLGDTKIVVDARDFSLTPHLVMGGFWESWITAWFMRNVMKADRVLNIGANCGYYALTAARVGANVVAVEPQLHLSKAITISAMLNGWGDRIQVRRCVAGSEERRVDIQLYPDFHGSPHVKTGVEEHADLAKGTARVAEYPAHTLMPDATCVFVDAEGYEPYIWEGLMPLLKRKQLRWVALEWAPSRYDDAAAFLGSLRSIGDIAVVNNDGMEERVGDAELLQNALDWDTVVVRPRT
jgi:FkbM family methyltransferase